MSHGKAFASNYTPAKHGVNTYKAAIRLAFADVNQPPLDGPIELRVVLVFPRRKTRIWKNKPMPREWHTRKPDVDNVQKAILDSLNKLAWHDDSQICKVSLEKHEASGDEQPRTEIEIKEIA